MKENVSKPIPATSTLEQQRTGSLTSESVLTSSENTSPGASPKRKSLIPLPKEKTRAALTPLQNSATPTGNEMVGRKKSEHGTKTIVENNKTLSEKKPPSGSKSNTATSTTPRNALSKVRSGFVIKRKTVEKGIQTDNADGSEIVTGEEASLTYWKELAETRREALEETLKENEDLHKRVEYLEKENAVMEELVEDAKKLAEIITSMPDDDNPDESGFGGEAEDTGFSHDDSSS